MLDMGIVFPERLCDAKTAPESNSVLHYTFTRVDPKEMALTQPLISTRRGHLV